MYRKSTCSSVLRSKPRSTGSESDIYDISDQSFVVRDFLLLGELQKQTEVQLRIPLYLAVKIKLPNYGFFFYALPGGISSAYALK